MHQVTWIDENGQHRKLEFAIWKFASQRAKMLSAKGYKNVVLSPIRKDAYRYNLQTNETWIIARNKLLSRLTAEIEQFLIDNPDVTVIITPASKNSNRRNLG